MADGDADFKKQVEALVKSYQDAVNSNNVDGVLANYVDTDPIFVALDGRVAHGKEAIGKSESGFLSMKPHEEITVTEAHRDGDSAFAIGAFNATFGGKLAGTWNAVYDVKGGQPRIKLLAVSVPPPPPPK
jgi:uncharacterized protein (TIGR02246 family)